jgi:hypothetical protein
MIFDEKYKEIEMLILNGHLSLDDLSEEAFQIFKKWIESPTQTRPKK